jgi:mycofactocin system glycosyltransferase
VHPGPRGAIVGSSPARRRLARRLLDRGLAHPRPASGPFTASDVTCIIPTHGEVEDLGRTLRSIAATQPDAPAVIVVDDASPAPIPAVPGATVLRRAVNGGPGQARSSGLEHVHTPLVAFVDSDVTPAPGWLDGLLGHFADDRVALVAPRVASAPGPGALARFDTVRSPLDLGPAPARVRAGTRVSYVPAAVMVARVEALRAVGGFDPGLRVGEDVDLVWRLDEAGWRVRYEPAVIVQHAPRPSLTGWLRQRHQYGTSAAPLAARHPGALAPVRVSGWSAASWLAVAAGWPVVGAAIAAGTTALLARKLRTVPDGTRLALHLAGLGHLHAGRSLASGVTRAWWPFAIAVAVVSRRGRRAVVMAAVVPAAFDWWSSRPPLDPLSYVALRNLDDAAYGSGLWTGVITARSLDAIRPDLTSWPKPGRGPTRAATTPAQRPADR